ERLQLAGHVYQSSSEGILVTDADDRIVAVNPAFSVLTGYAAEEVVGRNPKFLASGETPPETYVAMRTALREGGRWQGELYNRRKNGELFVEWLRINTVYDENGDVLRRIGLFSDITEKKKSDQLVWHQANFDPLTGLPNRRLFRDRLLQEMRRSERSGQLLALLFIDLDKFKAVNDRLGHETGDRLLAEAAQRISECVRSTDTVARLGGDEFTLVLPGIGGAPQIERVAHALITRLEKEFRFGAESAHISASVGVALYAGDATSMDTLIARADAAMYAAKSAGRSCFRYYTDDTPAGDSPPAVAAAGSAQGEPVMHGGTACRA
ncbi:MAG: diguanylate cyclase, partial [Rhodocyclaceae bacterium]|nr:diguanylate cyclase [Rhodocyclaceae bacterium]